MGHFQVTSNLCLKARQSAKPLIPKQFFILVEIKLISQERFGTNARFESDSFGTRNWPIESSTICMFCDLNFFSIPIEALLRSSLDLPHSLVPSISSSNFSELVMRLIFLQE